MADPRPRRLLGARSYQPRTLPTRRRRPGLEPAVRQVLARRHPRGLRPRTQPVLPRSALPQDYDPDRHAQRTPHPRSLRLGLRGGVLHAGRLPVEPGQPVDRLLAIRYRGRSRSRSGEQHRRSVSADPAHPLPQDRRVELRLSHRRGGRHRQRHPLGEGPGRSPRALPPRPAVDSRHPTPPHPATEPPAEHQPRVHRRNLNRRREATAGRLRQGLGRSAQRPDLAQRRPTVPLLERAGRLATPLLGRPEERQTQGGHPRGLRCHRTGAGARGRQ